MISKDDITLNTSWFDANPDQYLSRPDFQQFQQAVNVDLRDLVSGDIHVAKKAQEKITKQCHILNEVQKLHFGFTFPLFVYTNCKGFCEAIPSHNLEADKILLSTDMCDSLRRHIALSQVLIPDLVKSLYERFNTPLTIKNLGSGIGLDVLRATISTNGRIAKTDNYEIATAAVAMGKKLVQYAEEKKQIEPGWIEFFNTSLTESKGTAHLIIKVGIICGLSDREAKILLRKAYKQLVPGGKILVTSSNYNMHFNDPLASFVIQRMGTRENPLQGWALNCRTRESILSVLEYAGFSNIELYTDAEYPGLDSLPEHIRYGIDTFAGQAFGYEQPERPLRLPPTEVLNKKIGYNWIAVGEKC